MVSRRLQIHFEANQLNYKMLLLHCIKNVSSHSWKIIYYQYYIHINVSSNIFHTSYFKYKKLKINLTIKINNSIKLFCE